MPTENLIDEIDRLMQDAYAPEEPGAAVIVVENGDTIYRGSRGMANLELGVLLEPSMVFRIASITKQITAVAILILVEKGELEIDDPITRFLPEYPTHSHVITIRHLLTHTSGIMNYTNMPEWHPLWRKDFTVEEMIDFFKDQPMQFSPGEAWEYSNSGYTLLGAIIEKLSGLTYAEFVQTMIFDPLGMQHSTYDTPSNIVLGRVSGYERGEDGFVNSEYISMTQPYAAGALVSTVDDLATWDSALYTEKLLKQSTLQLAFDPYQLSDGTFTNYGFGWGIGEYGGFKCLKHSGGIHGFRTIAIRIPEKKIFVAVLSNKTTGGHAYLAFKIAALAIGQPIREPEPIELSIDQLEKVIGKYQIKEGEFRYILLDKGKLFSKRGEDPPIPLIPFEENRFFFENFPYKQLRFDQGPEDDIEKVEKCDLFGTSEWGTKTDTDGD